MSADAFAEYSRWQADLDRPAPDKATFNADFSFGVDLRVAGDGGVSAKDRRLDAEQDKTEWPE